MTRGFKFIMLEEAKDFILGMRKQVMKKILDNVHRVAEGEMNVKFFKKLESSDIWEFRTLYDGIQYRLFAFWDTDNETFVIATHGVVKKTQKTPAKEIAKAERIRKEYFNKKQK